MKLEPIIFEKTIPKKIINDEKIEEIISMLISDGFQILESDEILFQIIKYTKCVKSEASDNFGRMKELGLGICFSVDFGYSIRRFANMRGYISDSELEKLNEESLEVIRKEDPVVAKFMEKHGVDKTGWSDDVVDEFEYGD